MITTEDQTTNAAPLIALSDTVAIDLPTLIETRMVIQANSGGGKSWAIRRILEQSHGKVQQIVIDVEGSFRSLREKLDVTAQVSSDLSSVEKSSKVRG